MELSFSLNYLLKQYGSTEPRPMKEAVQFCRDAGFRYVDYTPDFLSADWEERAHRDRELLEAAGISVEQTHVPFNRYRQYDDEQFPRYCRQAWEASRILGAKYVVVHADEYRTAGRYDEEEILRFTCAYLAPYVEYAEKNGLVLAVEIVFEDQSRRWPPVDGKSRFTSRVGELKAVIEHFASPTVACCWDFGHAKCAYGNENMLDAMKAVGRHIVCTHVHDNYYGKDLHLMPFLGEIDWEAHLACLRELGYAGKLSFELVYGNLPDPLLPGFLHMVHAAGDYMNTLFGRSPSRL
ncbi:MAG: sugar phosphate isomerase/epimerase [Clostridia bacterium]|nr:sugar phosphate isomerase/epimerase [Clostridia bacterium]